MSEKRKEHRFKAELPIKIIYAGAEIAAKTDNLSRLGTYVEISREIPAGESVDITLVLPAYTGDISMSGEVRCEGSVFRSVLLSQASGNKYYGAGIFFTVFSEHQHRDKLSNYIDYLVLKEEQEIKDGLKRRKEKEETSKLIKHPEEFYLRVEEFQKESLNLLHKISFQLEEINRVLQADNKKK